jgi:hypothetical protein
MADTELTRESLNPTKRDLANKKLEIEIFVRAVIRNEVGFESIDLLTGKAWFDEDYRPNKIRFIYNTDEGGPAYIPLENLCQTVNEQMSACHYLKLLSEFKDKTDLTKE